MAENASVDGRVGKFLLYYDIPLLLLNATADYRSHFRGCKSVNLQSDTTILYLTTYLVFLSLMG